MNYYKSLINGNERVCAADEITGKVCVIVKYKNTNLYNVLNQDLSVDKNGYPLSQYEMYLSGFEPITKTEFTTYVNLVNSFLDNL